MKKKDRVADIHCHILPALDDGSGSMEESMEMLRIAVRSGITDIIATPHYRAGMRNPSPDTIRKRVREVRREAVKRGVDVNLYPGNEVRFFSELEDIPLSEKICTLNDSPYILIEFSPTDSYRLIRNALDEVLGMELVPVIAHVERYRCLLEDWKQVEALRGMGAQIQVNASSLTGKAGHKVKKLAWTLLRGHLVDYIGTDAHGSQNRTPDLRKCLKLLHRKCEEPYIEEILWGNARKLLISRE